MGDILDARDRLTKGADDDKFVLPKIIPEDITGQNKLILGRLIGIDSKLEDLVNVTAGLRLEKKIDFSISYPSDGTRKTVGAGTTTIDFFNGIVTLPDGTKDIIRDSLQKHGRKFARSFYVDATLESTVQVDDEANIIPISADDFVAEGFQNFQRLTIETIAETEIFAWCCTNPTAFLKQGRVAQIRSGAESRRRVSTDPDTEFTDAITAGSSEKENISGLLFNNVTITEIAIESKENIRYRVVFYGSDSFEDSNPKNSTFSSHIDMDVPNDGFQDPDSSLFVHSLSNVAGIIEYSDDDGTKELHVKIIPVGNNKTAGVAGALKITFKYVPRAA